MIALNLGCHDIHMTNMTNIDSDPESKPDLILDCKKISEYYDEESVDFVYAGHFLEHFSVDEGTRLVSDIFKILKVYGCFIAIVPDYSKCQDLSIDETERIIMAVGTHKVLMNANRLKKYFKDAGFLTVVEAMPSDLAHCPFPDVKWQTCIIGLKHQKVNFYGI